MNIPVPTTQQRSDNRRTGPAPRYDFSSPAGEPALAAPDSVSWCVFKNPVALFIGGITAVILELAEPRVRTGVWEHSSFRSEPLARMQRTGMAAMVTVYGPRSTAQRMIEGITRLHSRVQGETPEGLPYRALQPELMNWVQVTASFGFLQAYHNFVRPLSDADRNRFYAESEPAARLYGATGAPTSEAAQEQLFRDTYPLLRKHPIVFEFLDILRATPALPGPLRLLQEPCIRAAIEILPGEVKTLLELPGDKPLSARQARWIRRAARLTERLPLPGHPALAASRRVGLPRTFLYRPSG